MPQQYLFRSPNTGGDGDPPEIPKSFIADDDEPKTPKSFIADEAPAEKKPSVFSRIGKAASDIGSNLKKDVKELIPSKDKLYTIPKGENKDETRTDTNTMSFDQNKWTNEASKLPESWHGLPIRRPAAFLGSLAGTALESLSAPENIAAMGAGVGVKAPEKEIPIRQSREIPYRMEDAPKPTEAPTIKQGVPREFASPEDPDVNAQPGAAKGKDTEQQLYNIARNKQGMAQDLPEKKPFVNPFEKPAEAPESFIADAPVEKGTVQLGQKQEPIIEHPLINPETGAAGTPESIHPDMSSLLNHGDGIITTSFAKDVAEEDVQKLFPEGTVTDMSSKSSPNSYRIDFKNPEEADNIEKSVGGAFDSKTEELHGGLGGAKPPNNPKPSKGPNGAVLDKLFTALQDAKSSVGEQEAINKAERAKRFAAFSSVKDEGVKGAAKSLSTLKGEFEQAEPGAKLKLKPKETDSLFTAVKNSNITVGEKARGYTALFKLLNGESIPQRNELKILDDVFGNGFADKITELHGGIGAVGLKLSKVANTMKSMQNALSLAAPLRHGIGLATRKEFYPAFADMFKFFGNKEFYETSMQALEERPNYLLGRDAGLFLAKPGSLMGSEEEFLNSYAGQIPGVRNVVGASQRAYTGFLNKLRADTFDSMIKQAKSLGNDTFAQVGDSVEATKTTKAIANFINNATGRGSLGPLNKMTNELNLALWSPRMMSSRIQMFTNPKLYMDLPKGMRREGLKSLLGIAALGTTIDTLAAYGGAKVSTNILSTDFRKSRFGKEIIDPWGGFQQYVVAAARMLAGKTDSSTPTSRLDIAGRFLANKESPAAALAHTLLTAKFTGKSDDPKTAGNMTTQYGEKTSIQSQIVKQFVPIFIQDMNDLLQSDLDFSRSIGLDTALGAASAAGMSQDYPEKKPNTLKLRKLK